MVYLFGAKDGSFIKIGHTGGSLEKRKKQILSGQLSNIDLVLLAAVGGTTTQETELKNIYSHLKNDANSTETFKPEIELIQYINWLRQQWWIVLEETMKPDFVPDWIQWIPNEERKVTFDEDDPSELIPSKRAYSGPLAGTPWDRLSTPTPKKGDDFYTPNELIIAASNAMGGIDLDAASHWLANRVHKIPEFFHLHKSAFDNPWKGKVWLNPPYGNNDPWFERIKLFWDDGSIKQLCMISPVWVFGTQIAAPILDRAAAMTLLTPTPKFWGNPAGKTGTNHPHAIIYMGDRIGEFYEAFRQYGVPMKLLPRNRAEWDDMWAKRFDKPKLVWGE
jgi:ParB family chromosome partitioning protein